MIINHLIFISTIKYFGMVFVLINYFVIVLVCRKNSTTFIFNLFIIKLNLCLCFYLHVVTPTTFQSLKRN